MELASNGRNSLTSSNKKPAALAGGGLELAGE
jgi:hypothetical protein